MGPAFSQSVVEMLWLDANTFLEECFALARKVYDAGVRPDYILGITRGGNVPLLAFTELFTRKGVKYEHDSFFSGHYDNRKIGEKEIGVHFLDSLCDLINRRRLKHKDEIIITDDVWDSGVTGDSVFHTFEECLVDMPQIYFMTVYYKNRKNKSERKPFMHGKIYNGWIVFPHEVNGLPDDLLESKKAAIFEHLK